MKGVIFLVHFNKIENKSMSMNHYLFSLMEVQLTTTSKATGQCIQFVIFNDKGKLNEIVLNLRSMPRRDMCVTRMAANTTFPDYAFEHRLVSDADDTIHKELQVLHFCGGAIRNRRGFLYGGNSLEEMGFGHGSQTKTAANMSFHGLFPGNYCLPFQSLAALFETSLQSFATFGAILEALAALVGTPY